MRKAKDLEILAKEAESSSQPQPTEVIPATNTIQAAPTIEPKSSGPATKRKNPANDDDEGFITVQKEKGQAAKEVEISSQPQPAEVIPAVSTIQAAPTTEPKSSGPATKRKNPANDDDEGFITV
ncbi:hypothetical protein CEXT_362461 [Caerostris extrusa]|uniref:Uncharacterized protein n=1 Tax=Caerostris extrusa TaxID=172846 RepID=A0AAV4VGT0_CAEEX|nr:hypothetical protein CEXT_362461 [Caerostris extrusa]